MHPRQVAKMATFPTLQNAKMLIWIRLPSQKTLSRNQSSFASRDFLTNLEGFSQSSMCWPRTSAVRIRQTHHFHHEEKADYQRIHHNKRKVFEILQEHSSLKCFWWSVLIKTQSFWPLNWGEEESFSRQDSHFSTGELHWG